MTFTRSGTVRAAGAVSDGHFTSVDEVRIRIHDDHERSRPKVSMSPAILGARVAETVSLTAVRDGEVDDVTWEQVAGPAVALEPSVDGRRAELVPTAAGAVSIEVAALRAGLWSRPAVARIVVSEDERPGPSVRILGPSNGFAGEPQRYTAEVEGFDRPESVVVHWGQASGPEYGRLSVDFMRAEFVAEKAGRYVLEVAASDDVRETNTATIEVSLEGAPQLAGGCTSPGREPTAGASFALLALLARRRRCFA